MPVAPIDLDWARATFPSTFAVFGSPLTWQIRAFTDIANDEEYHPEDFDVVMTILARDLSRPHVVLLRTLSRFHEAGPATVVPKAWLLHLERCLTQSLQAGDGQSTYRSMLRDPGAYLALLAELDWAFTLRSAGGAFSAHNPSGKHEDPQKDSNYDLRWVDGGRSFHGDVKWFTDWLAKVRGESLLNGQVKLLHPDLLHPVTVRTATREWTVAYVIRAAEEVLALYQAAVNHAEDARWSIEEFGQVVRATWLPPAGETMIQGVAVDLGNPLAPGAKSITIDEGDIPQEEQHGAIRSNIAKAASQLPLPGEHDLCCPVIGSSLQTDEDDVDAVVVGTDDVPGIFHPASEEEEYDDVHAVFHFSLNFERAEPPANRVMLRRSARYFSRGGQLSAAQRQFLDGVVAAYATNTFILVP